ncbi:MAG TPA: type I-E CRISPR-associated protein Cse1/CasA [Blastocatellia bacterium]|nr:type I-E CRISPR-associated protein Cse1/CasA [Blastocatellia bacterium]
MPEFNLVDEPWIPCLMLETGEARDLSLRKTLTEAHRVRELFDNSPLVTVALHRFLLAVLHACFRGPRDFDEWKSLWATKRWDEAKINQYLDGWRHHFDLFDAERPFYQVPPMKKENGTKKAAKKKQEANAEAEPVEFHPIALLAHEAATGNNATLFDHRFNDAPRAVSPAEAARYLIARQALSVGGGVSHIEAGKKIYTSDAPLGRGFTVLAQGNNLFETLALNLIAYTNERPLVSRGKVDDAPVWEQNPPDEPNDKGTRPRGYIDYLTWQSRRIYLKPEGESPLVRRCQLQQKLKLSEQPILFDPFKCYEFERDDKGNDKAAKAFNLSPSKAVWRDSHALFQQIKDEKKGIRRPEVFNHLAMIELARQNNELEADAAYAFTVYGFATEPRRAANVIHWARERLPLPLSYLTDGALVEVLADALKLAEEMVKNLKDAVKKLAHTLVGDKDAGKLANSFGAESLYWSRLETPFKRLLVALPNRNREDEFEWARTVERTAWDALNQVTAGLSGSARDFKAITIAESALSQSLKKIKTGKKFSHLFPPTQTAGGQV